MRRILVIAGNTFLLAVRRRHLHIITIFTALILAACSLLSFFDLGVQVKFLKDLSMAAAALYGMAITVVLVTNQVPGEIENKTIYPLMAKPLGRVEFILGKYLGTLMMIFLNLGIIGIELLSLIWWKEGIVEMNLLKAISLIWVEMALFSSLCLCLSLLLSPPACATLSLILYFLSHSKTDYLHYLIGGAESDYTRWIFRAFYYLLPNLENFNLRDSVITGAHVSFLYVIKAGIYGISFTVVFLTLACLLFRKKEL